MMQDGKRGDIFNGSSFVFVLSLCLLFLISGVIVLLQRDVYGLETRAALFVRAILNGQGLFCPVLFNRPYPDYPPLYFLIAAAFCSLKAPDSALCIAMPSLLSGTILLAMVFYSARKHLGPNVAAAASLVLLGTPEFWLKSEKATVDMLLALIVFCSNWFFFEAYILNESKRSMEKTLGPLFLALSYLVKGPIGIVLCFFPCAIFLTIRKDYHSLGRCMLSSGLFAIFITSLYLGGLYYQGGEDLVLRVLDAELISRISGKANRPFYYYFVYMAVVFFPWILFFGTACFKKSRKCTMWMFSCLRSTDFNLFITLFTLTGIVPFLLASSRHGRYLLPAFPPIAILLGCTLEKAVTVFEKKRAARAVEHYQKKIFLIISLLLFILFPIISGRNLAGAAGLAAFISCCYLSSAFILKNIHKKLHHITFLCLLIFLVTGAVTILLEPAMSQKESGRQFVLHTEQEAGAKNGIFLVGIKPDGEGLKYCLFSRYYPGRIHFLKGPGALCTLPGKAIVVTYEKDLASLSYSLMHHKYTVITRGYIHNKKVVSLYLPPRAS